MSNDILKPTKQIAQRVLEIVDCGLTHGVGVQQEGKMCVEAAVCFAFGLPHGDNPPCVHSVVRSFKIALNDSQWSSEKARAKGLRRLAIAQLGSDQIDGNVFVKELVLSTIRVIVPIALRAAASIHHVQKHKDAMEAAAVRCEIDADKPAARAAADAAYAAARAAAAAAYAAARAAADAAYAAYAAARAAAYAARDEVLSTMAECAVQALIKCGSKGCEWLDLAPLAKSKGKL